MRRPSRSPTSTPSLRQRRREADEFYAELQHDIADADARLVQRQALAGMIWSKQFYYYDVPRVAATATRPSRRRRPSAATAATATGCTSTTPTSSRCPTSGSIPGTPPGTWLPLHPAGADRRGVRQGPARAADARVVHAPQRPAAGLRVGLRRRESAGARLGGLARLPDRSQAARRLRRPRLSRARLPQAACSTSPGG